LLAKIEAAFDYRGDVTVELTDGTTQEGFLANRNNQQGFCELYPTGGDKLKLPYDRIKDVRLTGEDHYVPFKKPAE